MLGRAGKSLIHKIPSVPFRKPGHGSLSCQICMPFHWGQGPMLKEALNLSRKPCLYSRGRHSASLISTPTAGQWPLKHFPPFTVWVGLQDMHPFPLSPTCHSSDQHLTSASILPAQWENSGTEFTFWVGKGCDFTRGGDMAAAKIGKEKTGRWLSRL